MDRVGGVLGYWIRLVEKPHPRDKRAGMSVPHLAAENYDLLLHRLHSTGRMVKVLLPQGLFQEDPS